MKIRGEIILEDWDRLRIGIDTQYDDTHTWFPAKAEVCGNCRGKGHTVNPAIDGNGLSAEDFAEDPDFAQDYMSGIYDVSCCECDGRGMTLVPTSEEGQEAFQTIWRNEYASRAEEAAERRMGC